MMPCSLRRRAGAYPECNAAVHVQRKLARMRGLRAPLTVGRLCSNGMQAMWQILHMRAPVALLHA